MKDSRLTLRELRILNETERALREDAELTARFREFGDSWTVRDFGGPPPDPSGGSSRPWLFAAVCIALLPVLMILHPAVGALLLLSAVIMGTAYWTSHRPDRPDRREPG
ncbi:hypothetical protein V1L54_21820 [Streptomyces sp. TRM 70361]|uniref:hypothetical protein n=1 Tax=Streptomyces sp. TRM 70361 TaxID=3116553 RepID=UPI002E7ACDCE|nr:hypothetical protein [Streptomyces sp. TRM 70361]MEE1942004.1 hypothetical protein [Streptomyces sp. TRM 70361]